MNSQSSATTAEGFLALRAWTYDPLLGGINSLVQSGRLGLLRDDSLRVAVAGWPDIVEDLNGDERSEDRNTFEELGRYLIAKGAIFDALRSARRMNRLDVEPDSDLSKLLADPVFLQNDELESQRPGKRAR